MENKRMSFSVDADNIAFKRVLNDSFLSLSIKAISTVNPNLCNSYFTKESLEDAIPTFRNKPILGSFESDDFGSHDGTYHEDAETGITYWDTSGRGERILGLIRESDNVQVVHEEDGLDWLELTCVLWTRYAYKQVKRLLKDAVRNKNGGKSVSVEIDVLNSEVDPETKIMKINKFALSGITILGSKYGREVQPGIPGAAASILDSFTKASFAAQTNSLRQAYALLDEKNEPNKKESEKMKIKVDKSAKALSNDKWGSVDKKALRKKVAEAENFKEVAKDIFLKLVDGWEKGEVSKLQYPVMQLKDDTAVYNRDALAAAKGFAEKNNEKDVLSKLATIYKDLGLEDEKEKSEKLCADFADCAFCYGCDDDDDDGDEDDLHMKGAVSAPASVVCASPAPEAKPEACAKPAEPAKEAPKDTPKADTKKMSAEEDPEHHEDSPEEKHTRALAMLANLTQDSAWRVHNYEECIEHFKEDTSPGKDLVIATLERMKATGLAEIQELAALLAKISDPKFVDNPDDAKAEEEFAKDASCSVLHKEAYEAKAKCAASEKELADVKGKYEECLAKEKVSDAKMSDLQTKCSALEKKEFLSSAKETMDKCSDLSKDTLSKMYADCESGKIKDTEALKVALGQAYVAAKQSEPNATYSAPITPVKPITSFAPAAETGKDLDVFAKLDAYVHND